MDFRGSLDDIMIRGVRIERRTTDDKLLPLVKGTADLLHHKLRRAREGGFNIYNWSGCSFEYYETLEGVIEYLQERVPKDDPYYCLLGPLRIVTRNEYATFRNMRRSLNARFNARHPGMYKDEEPEPPDNVHYFGKPNNQ